MTCLALTDASLNIYERDNILISNFNGVLNGKNLESALKIWSNKLEEADFDLIFADFTEAVVETSKDREVCCDSNLHLLKEITVHTPKELFSRILLKNLFSEYSSLWGFEKPTIRFVDRVSFSYDVEKNSQHHHFF